MIFKKKSFSNERVVLDGNEYYECTFTGCDVVYKGGDLPAMKGSGLHSCNWVFDDAAERTIQFLAALHNGGFSDLIEDTFKNIRGGALPEAKP